MGCVNNVQVLSDIWVIHPLYRVKQLLVDLFQRIGKTGCFPKLFNLMKYSGQPGTTMETLGIFWYGRAGLGSTSADEAFHKTTKAMLRLTTVCTDRPSGQNIVRAFARHQTSCSVQERIQSSGAGKRKPTPRQRVAQSQVLEMSSSGKPFVLTQMYGEWHEWLKSLQ
jgi:hypothetical protein